MVLKVRKQANNHNEIKPYEWHKPPGHLWLFSCFHYLALTYLSPHFSFFSVLLKTGFNFHWVVAILGMPANWGLFFDFWTKLIPLYTGFVSSLRGVDFSFGSHKYCSDATISILFLSLWCLSLLFSVASF